jgi:superfamily II DNA helicase RecQ
MMFERPTIVISPLIALMADQEQALRRVVKKYFGLTCFNSRILLG